ncbi:uncharacterized protein LOC135472230 [Liolophura sinensis]|uniref:uncharacterized protein LOC135472230 n=1 Tax=Liolophura sinensis TaxID=3198878 RepID=UPI003158F30B
MGSRKYLFMCVCVLCMVTSTALQPRLPCAAQLFGCGLDVGFDFQNDCCECLEFFPTDESLSIDILCAALEDTPSCCPCAQTALTQSPPERDCSDCPQEKLEDLVDIFEKLEKIARRIARLEEKGKHDRTDRLKKRRARLVKKGVRLIDELEREC